MATVHVTKDTIDQLLADNETVILDFWAEWCGPCRGFAPVFEAASNENADVAFGKVDVDAQQDLATTYEVRQIPTIVAIRNGKVVRRQVGAMPGGLFAQFVGDVKTCA